MTTWPHFVTKDLGDSDKDAAEMLRRWQIYDRDMKALIVKGGVHQDEDGWWIDTATGDLIGPDPDIERPLLDEDFADARPFREVMSASSREPQIEEPEEAVTLRLPRSVLQRWQRDPNWREKMIALLQKAG